MDILSYGWEEQVKKEGPLARRMAPRSLEEFVGQEHLVGKDKPLRRALEKDRLGSFLFYGPPGTGKTALARIIAATTSARFMRLNAVATGVKEVRQILAAAREDRVGFAKKTILFVDEIHRFNKAQQDVLLPAVEEGLVYLLGATTENPFFSIIPPLLSRSLLFTFKSLGPLEIRQILLRALGEQERGLGRYNLKLSEEALAYLIKMCAGDARLALNALEMAALSFVSRGKTSKTLALEEVREVLQQGNLNYDSGGDSHYDLISAFIKSIRGSDPDGALYWLARMLESGEDPLFITRRLIISASEDIGNADPRALSVAVAAARAVERIGLPEGRIPLAQAATYLASAPKSNAAYKGMNEALAAIRKNPAQNVPPHLRATGYWGADRLGHGRGYLYPHDFPGNFVPQHYLPEGLRGVKFYRPHEQGYEKEISGRLTRWRKEKEKAAAQELEARSRNQGRNQNRNKKDEP